MHLRFLLALAPAGTCLLGWRAWAEEVVGLLLGEGAQQLDLPALRRTHGVERQRVALRVGAPARALMPAGWEMREAAQQA